MREPVSWGGYQLGIQLTISLIWVLRLVLAAGSREHTRVVLLMGSNIRTLRQVVGEFQKPSWELPLECQKELWRVPHHQSHRPLSRPGHLWVQVTSPWFRPSCPHFPAAMSASFFTLWDSLSAPNRDMWPGLAGPPQGMSADQRAQARLRLEQLEQLESLTSPLRSLSLACAHILDLPWLET